MKIKFNPTDGLILIPTRLHGPKGDMIARLALDTGATGSMIEILGRFKKNFPILCHTLPPGATIDGLLGLDFFRGTRFTIDLKLGTFQT